MAGSSDTRAAGDAESQRLWRLAAMGGTMASEIVAGAIIGWLLDRWLGTGPTLLIVLTIGGVVIGMTTFIRAAVKASRRSSDEAEHIAATRPLAEVPDDPDPDADGDDDGRPGSAWRDS